jgi:hypothetical protein
MDRHMFLGAAAALQASFPAVQEWPHPLALRLPERLAPLGAVADMPTGKRSAFMESRRAT